MPPLQKLDTGLCDSPIMVRYQEAPLYNVKGGRPTERLGQQGSWTHGVVCWGGGARRSGGPPKDMSNRGSVLFTSESCRPNLKQVPRIKPGTEDERQGRLGSFEHNPHRDHDMPVQVAELNHGTVLFVSSSLKADLSFEGRTNIAGGRPTERVGRRGGFTPGVRIWAGGAPRDVRPPQGLINRGTVLYTSSTLQADDSRELHLKDGTVDERQGRVGSFEHGHSPRLSFKGPTGTDPEPWKEAGQKGGRRYGGGHFLAGTTVWHGVTPQYQRPQ